MLEFLPEFHNDWKTYLFFGFCGIAGFHLFFVLLSYTRLAFHKSSKEVLADKLPPVSIIIAARNESQNLFNNIPFIMDQDYPEFEVIVVNHQSIDDSQYILDAMAREYKNLRVIKVEKSKHLKYGKKLPLTIGIKGAKYEHLLFTDADCKPEGKAWIKSMAQRFNDKKQIVMGYGPYRKEKGFLNRFIRFDTTWIAVNYFSFAKMGAPYMAIGRNLAYTKTTFNNANGFKSHYSLSSGDDDLFIQEAAKKKNYTINIDHDSFCYSDPVKSWSKLIRQKSRHYTTTEKYKVIKKWMLGIYPLTLLLLTTSFVILLFDMNFLWLTLAFYLFVLIIKWIILGRAFKKLQASKFIVWLPVWDLMYSVITPVLYYTIDKKDTKKW